LDADRASDVEQRSAGRSHRRVAGRSVSDAVWMNGVVTQSRVIKHTCTNRCAKSECGEFSSRFAFAEGNPGGCGPSLVLAGDSRETWREGLARRQCCDMVLCIDYAIYVAHKLS